MFLTKINLFSNNNKKKINIQTNQKIISIFLNKKNHNNITSFQNFPFSFNHCKILRIKLYNNNGSFKLNNLFHFSFFYKKNIQLFLR